MSSSKRELAVASKSSELILSSVQGDQPSVSVAHLKKMQFKSQLISMGGVLGGVFSAVGGLLGVAMLTSPYAATIESLSVVGVSSIVMTTSIVGIRRGLFLYDIAAVVETKESKHVKQLLYKNFGRSGGITPQIVHDSTLKSTKWVHNNELFSVNFDSETNIYSFDRRDYFEGAEEAASGMDFENELKPVFLKLKATDAGEQVEVLVKSLLRSVSQLVRTPLNVETKHEVKRLLVDANELIDISDNLAVFDESAAEAKLVTGLKPLIAEATSLVENERKAVEQRFDSYAGYVEARSNELSPAN